MWTCSWMNLRGMGLGGIYVGLFLERNCYWRDIIVVTGIYVELILEVFTWNWSWRNNYVEEFLDFGGIYVELVLGEVNKKAVFWRD